MSINRIKNRRKSKVKKRVFLLGLTATIGHIGRNWLTHLAVYPVIVGAMIASQESLLALSATLYAIILVISSLSLLIFFNKAE